MMEDDANSSESLYYVSKAAVNALKVTLGDEIGRGTYNIVYDVLGQDSASKPSYPSCPMVIRISLNGSELESLRREIYFYNKLLETEVAFPYIDYVIIKDPLNTNENSYFMGLLMPKANGSLIDIINTNPMGWSSLPEKFMKNLSELIVQVAKKSIFQSDIKPDNIVVNDYKLYMIDFDPRFFGEDDFLTGTCNKYNIDREQCVIEGESRVVVNKIYAKTMMFQLYNFLKKDLIEMYLQKQDNGLSSDNYSDNKPISIKAESQKKKTLIKKKASARMRSLNDSKKFLKICDELINMAFPSIQKTAIISGVEIPTSDIIENVLSSGSITYSGTLKHYFHQDNMLESESYKKILGDTYVEKPTPPDTLIHPEPDVEFDIIKDTTSIKSKRKLVRCSGGNKLTMEQ